MNKANVIAGSQIAASMLEKLVFDVLMIKQRYSISPSLAILMVGDDDASSIYVQHKLSKAREVGIEAQVYKFPHSISGRELRGIIKSLNGDTKVHGILIQLPLPKSLISYDIINEVDPFKDVDGFTVHNIGLLHAQQNGLKPATPEGCMILVKKCLGDNLSGKKAVVLGRSQIVGRPMASMLINEHCTVTLMHSMSLDIAKETREADILISAVGRPEMLTADFIKPGACVIDVGITRTSEGIKGDVDFASVSGVAGFLTPVPGGVGPMTVACMLYNTVKACCLQNKITDLGVMV